MTPYGLSKLATDQFLEYQSKKCEMDIIIVRLPNVYGSRQRPDLEGGVIAIFMEKMKNSKKVTFYGDGEILKYVIFQL